MTDHSEAADDSEETTDKRLVEGWHGRYYEDFTVGDVYKHPFGRTVTETDNVWMTNVTMNLNPMHFNEGLRRRDRVRRAPRQRPRRHLDGRRNERRRRLD